MSPALKHYQDQQDQRVVPGAFYDSAHDAKLAQTRPTSLSRPRSRPKRAIAPQSPRSRQSLPSSIQSSRQHAVVRKLSSARTTPQWLTLLVVAQRSSTAIVTLLVAAALGVYGWTVFSQQQWGAQYQRKVELEKAQRDYATANEAFKYHSGQTAESPDSGLALPGPNTNLFLQPMPLRPSPPAEKPVASFSELTIDRPVGY